MNRAFAKLLLYLGNFLKVQTVVTAVSLPIMVLWGMPFSCMSFVGNLLFTPVLTIFLIQSSLVFFTELFAIPNDIIISSLCATTSFWESTLSYGKKYWLMGLAQPGKTVFMLLVALAALAMLRVVFHLLSKVIVVAIVALSVFAVAQYISTPEAPAKKISFAVPQSNNKLIITQTPEQTIEITDNGFFNRKSSPEKFIDFELKPYLMKKYGTITIDKVTLQKRSKRNMRAVRALQKTFTVNQICLL